MLSTPYERTLLALAEQGPELMVLTAENRSAIRGLPATLGSRFVDFGIAEQTMVGAAAGLALRGRKPIAHALSAFLVMRAFEFIRTDVAIPQLPVMLVGAIPGFLSEANGPTHQALEDIALMRVLPGMQIFCPADEEEMVRGLPHFYHSGRPTYVRFNNSPPQVEHTTPFEIGRAEVFGDGGDVAILTYGFLLQQALEAQHLLHLRGVRARVVNMRSLAPVDEDAIIEAAESAALLVTMEDHFAVGGLYSIACEVLLEHRHAERVVRIALEARWFKPALLGDVLKVEQFDAASIAALIEKEVDIHG